MFWMVTRGITGVTNDGRFELWAVMGFSVHRGGPSSSGVVAANAAMRGGTAGTRELCWRAMAGTGAATTGTVATLGCGFRPIMVVHKDRRPR